MTDVPASPEAPPAPQAGDEPHSDEATRSLILRAERGEEGAMRELRPMLAEIPHWEDHYINAAGFARRCLLDAAVGQNLLHREAWERQAYALERKLAGPHPSPLERVLCERIATCWLDAHLADIMCADWLKRDGYNFKAGEFYSRRQERAHSRYVGAMQALARVRQLLATPLVAQVNIAQPGAQQLNVAAPAIPDQQMTIPAGNLTMRKGKRHEQDRPRAH